MSIRVAPLEVSEAERATLEGWVRSSTVKSEPARWARIVPLAAERRSNTEVAGLVGVSRPTVSQWRGRFQAGGLAPLEDLDRPGRPRTVSHNEIVVAALTKPPVKLGITHSGGSLDYGRLRARLSRLRRTSRAGRYGLPNQPQPPPSRSPSTGVAVMIGWVVVGRAVSAGLLLRRDA